MSIGGRFVFNDAADVPNTQIIYYDFPTAPVLYEVHNLRTAKNSKEIPEFRRMRVGVAVDCEGGSVLISNGGKALDKQGNTIKNFVGGGDHFANFIQAVRSGRREKLHAEILEGHLSTRICHAGNISYRLGRKAGQDEIRKVTQDVPAWNAAFDRLLGHLRAHEVDVDAPSITLGPWLKRRRNRNASSITPRPTSWSRAATASPTWCPRSKAERVSPRHFAMPRRGEARGVLGLPPVARKQIRRNRTVTDHRSRPK